MSQKKPRQNKGEQEGKAIKKPKQKKGKRLSYIDYVSLLIIRTTRFVIEICMLFNSL
jgi:hypothetical protein